MSVVGADINHHKIGKLFYGPLVHPKRQESFLPIGLRWYSKMVSSVYNTLLIN